MWVNVLLAGISMIAEPSITIESVHVGEPLELACPKKRRLTAGHSYSYNPFGTKVREMLQSRALGRAPAEYQVLRDLALPLPFLTSP